MYFHHWRLFRLLATFLHTCTARTFAAPRNFVCLHCRRVFFFLNQTHARYQELEIHRHCRQLFQNLGTFCQEPRKLFRNFIWVFRKLRCVSIAIKHLIFKNLGTFLHTCTTGTFSRPTDFCRKLFQDLNMRFHCGNHFRNFFFLPFLPKAREP